MIKILIKFIFPSNFSHKYAFKTASMRFCCVLKHLFFMKKFDKVVFSHRDGSVAPRYFRAYNLVATEKTLVFQIEDYKKILVEETIELEATFWEELRKAIDSINRKNVVFDDNLMGGSTRSFSFFLANAENDNDYLEWNGGETDAVVEKIVKSLSSKIKSLQQKIEDTKPKETDKNEDE